MLTIHLAVLTFNHDMKSLAHMNDSFVGSLTVGITALLFAYHDAKRVMKAEQKVEDTLKDCRKSLSSMVVAKESVLLETEYLIRLAFFGSPHTPILLQIFSPAFIQSLFFVALWSLMSETHISQLCTTLYIIIIILCILYLSVAEHLQKQLLSSNPAARHSTEKGSSIHLCCIL